MWRLSVNCDKTEIVHFRNKNVVRTDSIFKLGGNTLNIVPEYKYLGVVLNENLDYEKTGCMFAEASGRALGAIRNKLYNLKGCGYSTFTKLYMSCVTPIMDYAASVWGFKRNSKCESVQHRAARIFLGVHRFAAIHAISGDIGWMSAQLRHRVEMCRLWNKIVLMPDSRIPKRLLTWEINKGNNWASEIKNIFEIIEMLPCFDNMLVCDLDYTRAVLESNEVNEWDNTRFTKPKLRYYNLYKSTVEAEEYVRSTVISKSQRSVLAQFRSGTLPLFVETGRFRNIPLENRTCTICGDGIEDEFHVVCVCPKYNGEREILYQTAYSYSDEFENLDELDKFVFINNNCQIPLSKYLHRVMKLRQTLLYK